MKLPWWARLAAAFVSAAYWTGILAAVLLLIRLLYPDVVGALLVTAAMPYFGLYGAGFLVGLIRRPREPNLWAVYPAALQIALIVPAFCGDFIPPLFIWGPLALAAITIASGHMLKALFHPRRPASDVPGP